MTNSLLEKTSIHPSAVIHPSAEIGEGVIIGPNVVIGENVKLGKGCCRCLWGCEECGWISRYQPWAMNFDKFSL